MAVFTRTVTNVGPPNSTYTLSTNMPASIDVTVVPSVLSFSAIGEKKSFSVQVYGPKIAQKPIISGAIVWKYGHYVVRSPLVVYNILPGTQYGYPSFSMSPKKPDSIDSSMHQKNGIVKHKY
nr:subtilisin-like protease sbt4.14 [Quercus suber]